MRSNNKPPQIGGGGGRLLAPNCGNSRNYLVLNDSWNKSTLYCEQSRRGKTKEFRNNDYLRNTQSSNILHNEGSLP